MIGLKYIMFVTDTSLKDVASKLNVTPQLIAAWNKGTRNIGCEYRFQLAEYFNLDEEYFSKELTIEDKLIIELKIANKTYLDKRVIEMAGIAADVNSMRKKYKELLDKYIKLNNEHKNMKKSINSLSLKIMELVQEN